MLKKILIANRGEIARRIIRTAKKLGVATVAVYSDADARALHVAEADEAVHIGPSPAPESYLRGDKIIAAAKATGAEGIHPGYGFLAENADFAEAVGKAGLKFIGPSPAAMRALGGKAAAKDMAVKAGVPVVPGYQGAKQDAATLAAEARKIGYPVMIKAVAGGGGRGMRLVAQESEMAEQLASAQREAEGAFGNAAVLIEKVVERPRHIEVQVFGDAHGQVVHLFERDCSLQRRNQKVIEEAPAPGMSAALREKMCGAAVKLAKAVGYEGAGTVEFLVEGGQSPEAPSVAHPQPAHSSAPSVAHPQPAQLDADAKWYFIEMNTRLQVEHPVTEEITGLDLVEWQLRVASGEKLPLAQADIRMSGHAIEARLCAEDPAKGFLPSIGEIVHFGFVNSGDATIGRLETGVGTGDAISPYYDSMIAKVIVHASNRSTAAHWLGEKLACLKVAGPRTNAAFLQKLVHLPAFTTATMDTGTIGQRIASLSASSIEPSEFAAGIGGLLALGNVGVAAAAGPWSASDGFQLGASRRLQLPIVVNGASEIVAVSWSAGRALMVERSPGASPIPVPGSNGSVFSDATGVYVLSRHNEQLHLRQPTYDASALDDGDAGDYIRAPINGKVARIFVAEGQSVVKGERIAVVEAMKMEHVLNAQRDGTIAKVAASVGAQVNQGALIASFAEA